MSHQILAHQWNWNQRITSACYIKKKRKNDKERKNLYRSKRSQLKLFTSNPQGPGGGGGDITCQVPAVTLYLISGALDVSVISSKAEVQCNHPDFFLSHDKLTYFFPPYGVMLILSLFSLLFYIVNGKDSKLTL